MAATTEDAAAEDAAADDAVHAVRVFFCWAWFGFPLEVHTPYFCCWVCIVCGLSLVNVNVCCLFVIKKTAHCQTQQKKN